MIAGRCDRCGAPFARGQARCDWCRSTLVAAALPRPTQGAPGPAPYRELPMFGRHWRGSLVVAACTVTVLVVVFLVVAELGPAGLSPPVGLNAVHVTEVVASSPDDACGLNGANGGSFTANGSSFYPLVWLLPGNGSGALPCTVASISTTTPGFSIEATLPVTADAGMTVLSVDVYTPIAYSGPLAINFR